MLIGTPYHKQLNLDYLRGNSLHIELNNGRHRLYVSDCFSVIPKGGSGGFVHITNSSITNLGDELTDIFYSASNGTIDLNENEFKGSIWKSSLLVLIQTEM